MNIIRAILIAPGIICGILWGIFKTGLEVGEKFYYKLFE